MEKQRVLIVEADPDFSELLTTYLSEDYKTQIAKDGKNALALHKSLLPDLILLDLILPGTDGYDICREIRKYSNTPIIMLSDKKDVFDRVLGLELGADDFLTKPFDPKELIARIRAVLRRYNYSALRGSPDSDLLSGEYVSYPDLIISLKNYTVIYKEKQIEMPPKELELFYFLARHPNQVFSREQLLDHIWGYEYIVDTRTVDVHIKRLREKIKPHNNWAIATVWGIGYKFETIKQY